MKIISFVLFSCIGNQALDVSIHEYALRDPLLFGDYRNMINENEPRFYEDLLDYEAIYFLFQEVLMTLLSILPCFMRSFPAFIWFFSYIHTYIFVFFFHFPWVVHFSS